LVVPCPYAVPYSQGHPPFISLVAASRGPSPLLRPHSPPFSIKLIYPRTSTFFFFFAARISCDPLFPFSFLLVLLLLLVPGLVFFSDWIVFFDAGLFHLVPKRFFFSIVFPIDCPRRRQTPCCLEQACPRRLFCGERVFPPVCMCLWMFPFLKPRRHGALRTLSRRSLCSGALRHSLSLLYFVFDVVDDRLLLILPTFSPNFSMFSFRSTPEVWDSPMISLRL